MARLRLYHCHNSRSFRPLWALEELELPYELQVLPFPPRVRLPDFLQVNPLGTVPFFVCDDVEMTESAAICQFLATRFGPTTLAVEPQEADYGRYLNFLYFGEATLTFPQTLVLRYGALEVESRRIPQVVEDYTRWFLSRLRALDRALSNGEFLAAGRFTMADISVGYALLLAREIGLGDRLSASCGQYFERLSDRPAFQRAIAVQAAKPQLTA